MQWFLVRCDIGLDPEQCCLAAVVFWVMSFPALPDARAQRAAYKRALFIQDLLGERRGAGGASADEEMRGYWDEGHDAPLAAAPEPTTPKFPPLNLGILGFEEAGSQVASVAVRGVRTQWPLMSAKQRHQMAAA